MCELKDVGKGNICVFSWYHGLSHLEHLPAVIRVLGFQCSLSIQSCGFFNRGRAGTSKWVVWWLLVFLQLFSKRRHCLLWSSARETVVFFSPFWGLFPHFYKMCRIEGTRTKKHLISTLLLLPVLALYSHQFLPSSIDARTSFGLLLFVEPPFRVHSITQRRRLQEIQTALCSLNCSDLPWDSGNCLALVLLNLLCSFPTSMELNEHLGFPKARGIRTASIWKTVQELQGLCSSLAHLTIHPHVIMTLEASLS